MKGNENMKFSDIVSLAKAGYSPKDVKDLLELMETKPDDKKDPEGSDDKKDPEGFDDKNIIDAFEKLVNDNKNN